MKILLTVLVVPFLVLRARAASVPLSLEERAKEIARLEKQKSELFQQLNAAIDDSVRSLRAHNDSQAAVGISYIEELRANVKALNASPAHLESELQAQGAEIVDPEPGAGGARRAGGATGALRQIVVPPMKQSDAKFFDFKNVFGNKALNPAKWQERYANRQIMQQKLKDWLEQREKEKSAIKRYKTAQVKMEKCPRYGVGKEKKKKSRRAGDGDGGAKFPCCRKCCKKSYLGCL